MWYLDNNGNYIDSSTGLSINQLKEGAQNLVDSTSETESNNSQNKLDNSQNKLDNAFQISSLIKGWGDTAVSWFDNIYSTVKGGGYFQNNSNTVADTPKSKTGLYIGIGAAVVVLVVVVALCVKKQ